MEVQGKEPADLSLWPCLCAEQGVLGSWSARLHCRGGGLQTRL